MTSESFPRILNSLQMHARKEKEQKRKEIEKRNPLPEKQIFQNVRETEFTVPEGFFLFGFC